MSGLFEHLAAFDEGDQSKRRKIVAVANKRVADNFGAFLSNAKTQEELAARLALVEGDIKEAVQAVVAEYNGDTFDSTYAAVIAGWEDLPRSDTGQWGKNDSTEIGDEGDGVSDIEGELADAPSAVGQKAASDPTGEQLECKECGKRTNGGHCPDCDGDFKTADAAWDGGGAVVRESLPKADKSGLDGPSPKIDKSKAGDEKGHKHTPVPDTETSGSPKPTETQSVTDGRGDAEKGTSDLKHESPELTSEVLKKETLPTGDDWAGFADGGISSGPHTDTFSGDSQANPVSSDKGEGVLSSVDPDKNPIAELWASENQVQAAIRQFEE